jgi:hypothetical protein
MKPKPILLLLLVSVLVSGTQLSSFSQATQRIYVNSGEDQWDNFMLAIYLYPSFKDGMVEFKNGQRFTRPMNYNKIAGTIEFISEKNDTVAFADEAAVAHVNIGGDVFVFTPVCMRFLSSKKVKLYVYEKMKIGDKQKIGAFGIPNSGSAIETVDRIESNQRTYRLNPSETVILKKTTSYYVQTAASEILPANKKNILTLFSGNDEPVKEYFKSHNVNFNKESDLVELVNFLDTL